MMAPIFPSTSDHDKLYPSFPTNKAQPRLAAGYPNLHRHHGTFSSIVFCAKNKKTSPAETTASKAQ